MIPQSAFVGPKTRVLRFEESWQQALCARYDLALDTLPRVNSSKTSAPLHLSADIKAQIERRSAKDYKRFGYDTASPTT
jgi:hypothetical protein